MDKIVEIFTWPFFEFQGFIFSFWTVILIGIIWVVTHYVIKFFKAFIYKTLSKKKWYDPEKGDTIYKLVRLAIIIIALIAGVRFLNLTELINHFLDFKLLNTKPSGETFNLQVKNIFVALIIILFARIIIRFVLMIIQRSMSVNKYFDRSKEFKIIQLARYFLYLVAFVIVINSMGGNLSALLLGSAALLVGVGIGIQHIFNDVVSGFIILFEGTIQVGDIIEVDSLMAKVKQIDIRTSKLETVEGRSIIVPNRKLTSENMVNWTHNSPYTRFSVTVGVAYGSDVSRVREILYNCALKHPDVSKKKAIHVQFQDFGDSSLNFEVFFWANKTWEYFIIKSDIRFAIEQKFREEGIKIPFPQREIHYAKQATKSDPNLSLPAS